MKFRRRDRVKNHAPIINEKTATLHYNSCDMHLILTHEQADFDALAALFGASCIMEHTQPVLSRRMNRNVRAFVTLYGGDFPFLDPRDIPQMPVEMVTLVDTQSLVTLKGMSARTKVHVFDHHPRRKGTPKNWVMTAFDTGATTTYFVEMLQEHSEPLSAVQATLLLLGVYEDTGSLTYSATTPRDVRAAAWLLEQGASLRIAAEFLNPPLSAEQRETYDRLVASAETMDLHGHRIVLTIGEVLDLNEEISTLAHKLRDLFDPDALFVLVSTIEGVRLVARSTTDDIDVSAIAVHFNGGGHDRAAAALIRSEEGMKGSELLAKSKEQLLALLPQHVRPSVTVGQLMSRRPRTLAPGTTAQDAAKLMQRYGYEGFPVVDKGKVIGLLTRRAVDRAISHKLNLPAASLMEAGEIIVHPDDSLQHLQVRMTDSGWGQIPVVDPQSGRIIGIVTRTDLLKTLSLQPALSTRQSLSEKLENGLSSRNLAIIKAVADEASLLHLPVYIVGGFVRDLILGSPTLDFDIVVEGDAIVLARSLVDKHGGKLTSHTRFGTAKWFLEGVTLSKKKIKDDTDVNTPLFVDLISSRQEFYEHPSALPTVEHGSIKLDLHRRDFTINTLAVRLDGHHFGELHDYYGGLTDLERKFVRVLHSLSFVDDPTRMLRAVRYEQRYGFTIEPRTLQLMDEARPLMTRLSSERLRHELDLILDEPRASAMFTRLDELGLLKSILDVLPWNMTLHEALDSSLNQPLPLDWGLKSPAAGIPINRVLGYLIWLVSLPLPDIEKVHSQLRLPAAIYKSLVASNRLFLDLPGLKGSRPSTWIIRLEDVPILAIYAVYLLKGEPALQEYATKWRNVHLITDGHALRKRGLAPGPVYQRLLRDLRSARVDGEINSNEQELALLDKLLKKINQK
jgi:tRNA nucleotidyltransferase (CCA-adding enzyme)